MVDRNAIHDSTVLLPAPQERPEADIVIYDGQCRFCQRQVERLARWDSQGRLAYLSAHDPQVAARYPQLSHEQLMEQLYVVDQRGRARGGAAAFRYLTRRLPRLWWLAPLLHLPLSLPLWQWGYRQVASQRYRWGQVGCDDDSCQVHFKR